MNKRIRGVGGSVGLWGLLVPSWWVKGTALVGRFIGL